MSRADDASEHQIQCALIATLYYRMRPEIVRFSIPNGGLRNARVQNQMIDEGLCPGMVDLGFCHEDGRTFWLEMKTRTGALRDEQKGIRFKLEQLGHKWALARSVDEALDHLNALGMLK